MRFPSSSYKNTAKACVVKTLILQSYGCYVLSSTTATERYSDGEKWHVWLLQDLVAENNVSLRNTLLHEYVFLKKLLEYVGCNKEHM